MKNVYKQKREQGFTIVEVMIVLAIAAVILLIVLLAVPALQRNSRNTQRNNDAATLAAAINTCLANHNNSTDTAVGCGKPSNVDFDTARAGQLKNFSFGSAAGTTTAATYTFNNTCNTAGTALAGSAPSATSFAIQFAVETSSGSLPRCIDS